MEFNDNGKRMCINVDIDGTLTNGELFWETEPTPNLGVIERITELFKQGNIIIIHTARMWKFAPETVAWLTKYQIPYHGLYMQKGGSDWYIDDKSTNVRDL